MKNIDDVHPYTYRAVLLCVSFRFIMDIEYE